MRSLIIAALLMPPTASAPLDPADNHVLANETTHQTIFLKQTAPHENTAPNLDMFLALAPEMKPVTTSKINTRPQSKQTKKNSLVKGKKNAKRMNLLTVLMMYKGGKKR